MRQQVLKREEDALQRERERIEREKYKHMRCLKRSRDQKKSKFQTFPRMGSRQQYILMSLLGKGGFSEVYKVRARANRSPLEYAHRRTTDFDAGL